MTAVETVAGHKPFFTGMVSETLRHAFLTKGIDSPLTARERSVVQLIAEGHSNKKIASILNLSVKTVETHGPPSPQIAAALDGRPGSLCHSQQHHSGLKVTAVRHRARQFVSDGRRCMHFELIFGAPRQGKFHSAGRVVMDCGIEDR